MRIKKSSILRIMTAHTDDGSILLKQSGERRSMMLMALSTILHCRLVGRTLGPVSGDLPVAIKTKGRLPFNKIFIET